MISYQYNKELQIVEVSYKNDIYLKDIIHFVDLITHDEQLPDHLKLLVDACCANYQYSIEDLLNTDMLSIFLKKFKSLKEAFVHSKPTETAYSIMMEEICNPNYSHKVFISKENAIEWLIN